MARNYGYSSPLMDKREAYFKQLQYRADRQYAAEQFIKEHLEMFFILALLIFAGSIMGMILLTRKWIRKKRRRKLAV
jgi:hypothetical protein